MAERTAPPGAVETPPTFPPPTITRWVRGGTVSTDALERELRTWIAWFESPESDAG